MSTFEKDFYGFAGAGPITISLYDDEGMRGVVVSWPDGGAYLAPYRARDMARFLLHTANEASRLNELERGMTPPIRP